MSATASAVRSPPGPEAAEHDATATRHRQTRPVPGQSGSARGPGPGPSAPAAPPRRARGHTVVPASGADQGQDHGDDRHDADADGEDQGHRRRGSGRPRRMARWLAFQWRKLVSATSAPRAISGRPRMRRPPVDVELGQQLGGGDPGGDEGQSRPVPGQEGPLVGVGEPDVGLVTALRLAVAHGRTTGDSLPTPPPAAGEASGVEDHLDGVLVPVAGHPEGLGGRSSSGKWWVSYDLWASSGVAATTRAASSNSYSPWWWPEVKAGSDGDLLHLEDHAERHRVPVGGRAGRARPPAGPGLYGGGPSPPGCRRHRAPRRTPPRGRRTPRAARRPGWRRGPVGHQVDVGPQGTGRSAMVAQADGALPRSPALSCPVLPPRPGWQPWTATDVGSTRQASSTGRPEQGDGVGRVDPDLVGHPAVEGDAVEGAQGGRALGGLPARQRSQVPHGTEGSTATGVPSSRVPPISWPRVKVVGPNPTRWTSDPQIPHPSTRTRTRPPVGGSVSTTRMPSGVFRTPRTAATYHRGHHPPRPDDRTGPPLPSPPWTTAHWDAPASRSARCASGR